jgi:hypothetical protein
MIDILVTLIGFLAASAARDLQQAYNTPTNSYSPPSTPKGTPSYSPPATPPPYYAPYVSAPAPPTYDYEQWQKDAFAYVNKWYRWGGKWPVSWDYKLKDSCEKSAAEAATKYYYPYNKFPGEYQANSLPPWGETAFKYVPTTGNAMPGWQVALDYWYNTGAEYTNGYSPASSNYTQLTWKASSYWWICSAKDQYDAVYYYAHYYAPGNVVGYYADNVPPYTPVTIPATG